MKKKKDKLFLIIALIALLAVLAGLVALLSRGEESEQAAAQSVGVGYKVVIDAGHGLPDVGAIGTTLQTEEEGINLSIAKKLQAYLESVGFEVVMTREDHEAIAETKTEDMAMRREIISNSEQDVTISIHQNFFEGGADASGPQVFYAPGSEQGQALAECIQAALNAELAPESPRYAHEGDYYIVKSGAPPAVIVECGFLSNPAEEALLNKSQYQVKIVTAIAQGLVNYLQPAPAEQAGTESAS